jgi:hypothetical protein
MEEEAAAGGPQLGMCSFPNIKDQRKARRVNPKRTRRTGTSRIGRQPQVRHIVEAGSRRTIRLTATAPMRLSYAGQRPAVNVKEPENR